MILGLARGHDEPQKTVKSYPWHSVPFLYQNCAKNIEYFELHFEKFIIFIVEKYLLRIVPIKE